MHYKGFSGLLPFLLTATHQHQQESLRLDKQQHCPVLAPFCTGKSAQTKRVQTSEKALRI
jgi:hypothetical protein